MLKLIIGLAFLGALVYLKPWFDLDKVNRTLIIWYGRDGETRKRKFIKIEY